jgi:diguanylate cyclase (GGDEF)-like protein/putative nucleotidyltransferase with HDIG domain
MASASAPTFRELPGTARAYIPGVAAVAAASLLAASRYGPQPDELDIPLLVVAAVLCGAGNLYEVFAPGHFSFQPNLVFFVAAALLLPPWAIAVLAVACFAPGWVVHRFRWYMVSFNIANYALSGVAANQIANVGNPVHSGAFVALDVLTLAAAAAAFVLVNHTLIVLVVRVARGRPIRRGVVDMLECLPVDAALAATGTCLAVLWAVTPPVALLAAGPMLLMYRALWVPLLEHKSRTDPKTGLYNSEYLANELATGVAATERNGGSLAVVMIDIDQLRAVNNRHGHLVGDELIRAVASAVARVTGTRGIPARFGGDELCVALPGSDVDTARALAEQIRAAVEQIELAVESETRPPVPTVSIGVAAYPQHGTTVEDLLQAADGAVYDAKLGGRNRIRSALAPEARAALLPIDELDSSVRAALPERGWDSAPEDAAVNGDCARAPRADAAPEPAQPGRIRCLIAILLVGTAAAAAVAGTGGLVTGTTTIGESAPLLALLVLAVLVLDRVRIDVFERAAVSPASVPTLALAYFFGPLGPLAAELAIAAVRFARREPAIKWMFDLGALGLAGVAAACVFAVAPADSELATLLAAPAAALAYYAINTPLLAYVLRLAEGGSALGVWRKRFGWMLPHYAAFGLVTGTFVVSEERMGLFALAVFGLPVVMLWVAQKQYLDRARSSVKELRRSYADLERANERLCELLADNRALLGKMHRSYLSTITSLARTIEAKDPYTGGHTERVADISTALANELGYGADDLRAVRVGALIHDIGKIGVPDHVLLKKGALTDLELTAIRRHPEISSYILAELELPAIVKQMVRSHHERCDGAGYPDALAGEEIPLAARILTVADALDAMTSDRPYRTALAVDEALAEIRRLAGTQFCPRVVGALEACIAGGSLSLGARDEADAALAALADLSA